MNCTGGNESSFVSDRQHQLCLWEWKGIFYSLHVEVAILSRDPSTQTVSSLFLSYSQWWWRFYKNKSPTTATAGGGIIIVKKGPNQPTLFTPRRLSVERCFLSPRTHNCSIRRQPHTMMPCIAFGRLWFRALREGLRLVIFRVVSAVPVSPRKERKRVPALYLGW